MQQAINIILGISIVTSPLANADVREVIQDPKDIPRSEFKAPMAIERMVYNKSGLTDYPGSDQFTREDFYKFTSGYTTEVNENKEFESDVKIWTSAGKVGTTILGPQSQLIGNAALTLVENYVEQSTKEQNEYAREIYETNIVRYIDEDNNFNFDKLDLSGLRYYRGQVVLGEDGLVLGEYSQSKNGIKEGKYLGPAIGNQLSNMTQKQLNDLPIEEKYKIIIGRSIIDTDKLAKNSGLDAEGRSTANMALIRQLQNIVLEENINSKKRDADLDKKIINLNSEFINHVEKYVAFKSETYRKFEDVNNKLRNLDQRVSFNYKEIVELRSIALANMSPMQILEQLNRNPQWKKLYTKKEIDEIQSAANFQDFTESVLEFVGHLSSVHTIAKNLKMDPKLVNFLGKASFYAGNAISAVANWYVNPLASIASISNILAGPGGGDDGSSAYFQQILANQEWMMGSLRRLEDGQRDIIRLQLRTMEEIIQSQEKLNKIVLRRVDQLEANLNNKLDLLLSYAKANKSWNESTGNLGIQACYTLSNKIYGDEYASQRSGLFTNDYELLINNINKQFSGSIKTCFDDVSVSRFDTNTLNPRYLLQNNFDKKGILDFAKSQMSENEQNGMVTNDDISDVNKIVEAYELLWGILNSSSQNKKQLYIRLLHPLKNIWSDQKNIGAVRVNQFRNLSDYLSERIMGQGIIAYKILVDDLRILGNLLPFLDIRSRNQDNHLLTPSELLALGETPRTESITVYNDALTLVDHSIAQQTLMSGMVGLEVFTEILKNPKHKDYQALKRAMKNLGFESEFVQNLIKYATIDQINNSGKTDISYKRAYQNAIALEFVGIFKDYKVYSNFPEENRAEAMWGRRGVVYTSNFVFSNGDIVLPILSPDVVSRGDYTINEIALGGLLSIRETLYELIYEYDFTTRYDENTVAKARLLYMVN